MEIGADDLLCKHNLFMDDDVMECSIRGIFQFENGGFTLDVLILIRKGLFDVLA